MALVVFKNPTHVPLEAAWDTFEGAPKLDVVGATVRVYHVTVGGGEILDLPATAMTQIEPSKWRFNWIAPPLSTAGVYTAQYVAADVDGKTGRLLETIVVLDEAQANAAVLAKLVTMDGKIDTSLLDLGTVLDCHLGRQKLDALTNRWILFRRDGTVLKAFDTRDDAGNPSVLDIFDRLP